MEELVSVSQQVRRALRQQLQTDRLLGVRSVPMGLIEAPRTTNEGSDSAAKKAHTKPAGRPGPESPSESASDAERTELLRVLNETRVRDCRRCQLCETRTQTVFGQGSSTARLVFVGEAPGYEEDKQGLAFVGKAGQLLTKMIDAMGTSRDQVFICNVLKCRPPGNRDPLADEVLACNPYLREQLSIIQPEMIVALGSPAAKTLLNSALSIGKLRGRFHDYYVSGESGVGEAIPLMPTYHPAYLLRNPAEKKKTWDDLQKVMAALGLERP